MEFWGIEVKAGVPYEVKPFPGQLVHISQAALGETTTKDVKGAKSIPLRLKIDDKDLIIGSLKPEERTQVSFDLVFEKKFVLSHDWKNGSIYFAGYLADDPVSDTEYSSDDLTDESEDELEEASPAAATATATSNGAPKATKGAAAAAVVKSETKKKKDAPVADSDDDEDSEDGSDEDMEPSLGGDSSDELLSLGDDSEEDESEEEEEEEEEEMPKVKVQQSKKRPAESEAPVAAKKAKSTTPEKTGSDGPNGVEVSEDVGTDDDDAAFFDTDDESNSTVNDPFISERSMILSTFDNHLNYKLASTEIDHLMKKKWMYTWKMPALNMSSCNWRGTGTCSIKDLDANACYGLKPRLYKHWLESYKASGCGDFHQSKQRSFFSICNSYYDIMHYNKKPFYLKGLEEDSNIMDAYLMHSLNHIFRSRDLMVKNERKLSKNPDNLEGMTVEGDSCLDRGFTRPKVLILLPLAGIARRVVKKLIQLTPSKHKANVENLERFYEEFGSGRTENDGEDDQEIAKSKKSAKPADFQALLGRDNDNDHFMIGIKYTHKGIKLYGDFYTSDVLVASPLGLITKIEETEVLKEKDVDYLSSIEILIIDHADVMLMQNFSHVNTVVEQLNKLPTKQHGTDIMRIRPWYLDEQARFYRQTIILGSHLHPEINALFNKHCLNYQGKVKLECKYKGVLPKILIPVRQIYERFGTESIVEADDARFKYFCEKVFPKIKDSVQNGVMIFISSYFEFVRVRNYLKSQDASFCLFGEYIKRNDISHVRGQFFRGEKKIILYTERAHFYYRYKIRGVQNLIIYSLPERTEFYPELVNLLEESDSMNCRVLFSRLDHLRLERIVGSTAAKRMTDSEKDVFIFA